jgi:predicted nuclease of predicted toxin-antitoxin system
VIAHFLVLEKADAEGLVLITGDRDFGELVFRQRMAVRGVILLELDRLSNAAEAERAAHIVSKYSEKLLGNLAVIEPSRVRMRRLER